MMEETDKNIVDYYKGKNVAKADKLLFDTAQNNFKTGYDKAKEEILEKLKQIVYGKIDWIKVFRDAYEQRKTSWVELGHIQEWRNATDEVMTAFWRQFEEELKKEEKK